MLHIDDTTTTTDNNNPAHSGCFSMLAVCTHSMA